jgi:RNA polymerase sigma-70 factor (ECF subfamily)
MHRSQPHHRGMNDRLLVERARKGDERAFAALFERYHRLLLGFFARRLRDGELAREGAQETLARAFVRLDCLRAPERLRSWLFAFARLVLLEMLRPRLMPAAPAVDSAQDLSPETRLLQQELGRALEEAFVEELSAPRRAAVLLRLVDEKDYRDIGAQLDWSRAKVKNEIHRARVRLKHRLRSWHAPSPATENSSEEACA